MEECCGTVAVHCPPPLLPDPLSSLHHHALCHRKLSFMDFIIQASLPSGFHFGLANKSYPQENWKIEGEILIRHFCPLLPALPLYCLHLKVELPLQSVLPGSKSSQIQHHIFSSCPFNPLSSNSFPYSQSLILQ